MRIKWLHLSDIHFNFKNYDSHSLREDFIERILILSQSEPFTHLFLTGDILYRNTQADADTIEFIKKLIELLQLPIENVIIIPGNHDHDRNIVISKLGTLPNQEDVTIDSLDLSYRTSLLATFVEFNTVYTEIFNHGYYSKLDNPHMICTDDSVSIIKLNTAWLDTDSSNDQLLRIGSRQLQLLLSEENNNLQKTVNIAVGHHPIHELSPTEQNRLLKLFQKHNIGLYFCGHSHQANINVHSRYDVIEIIAPGGFVDDEKYSVGGYVWGVIDTDVNFYKAEIYNWNNGKWCIDSTLPETDDHGICYFNTSRFPNSTNVVAVDCKTMNGHISKVQLDQSLGTGNYDIHTYCGPYGNSFGYSEDTICDISDTIIQLIEKGKMVHLYPLAPIPMLLFLGFNLQNNAKLFVHQYDRDTDKWVYNEASDHISISHTKLLGNNDTLVISISTSFDIAKELILKAMNEKSFDYLEFKSNQIKIGYPLYFKDVQSVVQSIVSELNHIATNYSEIHIFAAIPAGLAVELGRNLLSSVYQNVYTYQLNKGHYVQDIIINQRLNLETSESIVTSFSLDSSNVIYIPILGRVPCGPLKEAITENDKCFPMPETLLENGDYYILMASGDSMIDAGIEDGDYILVKRQIVANEGDIVVALIEGETTIKRIHFDDVNKRIVLQPENAKYKSYTYTNLDIQGIAINVIKNL